MSDCCLTPNQQFFSIITARTSYIFYDDDDVRFVLDWVGFYIVLAHWNNSPRIDMSLHSDTLFWFTANQSLLFLLSATCLAEKHQILSVFWPERVSNQRSTALEARTLTITPSKRFWTQQNINTYVLSVSIFAKLKFIQLLLIFDCI